MVAYVLNELFHVFIKRYCWKSNNIKRHFKTYGCLHWLSQHLFFSHPLLCHYPLRILAGYKAKTAKNQQLLDILAYNSANISWITGQNVQKFQIFAVFASQLASILKFFWVYLYSMPPSWIFWNCLHSPKIA